MCVCVCVCVCVCCGGAVRWVLSTHARTGEALFRGSPGSRLEKACGDCTSATLGSHARCTSRQCGRSAWRMSARGTMSQSSTRTYCPRVAGAAWKSAWFRFPALAWCGCPGLRILCFVGVGCGVGKWEMGGVGWDWIACVYTYDSSESAPGDVTQRGAAVLGPRRPQLLRQPLHQEGRLCDCWTKGRSAHSIPDD